MPTARRAVNGLRLLAWLPSAHSDLKENMLAEKGAHDTVMLTNSARGESVRALSPKRLNNTFETSLSSKGVEASLHDRCREEAKKHIMGINM